MNGVVAAAGASSRSLDVRVACNEDGDTWPTRRAIMGTGSEQTSSFFVIDCLASWSFQSAPLCPCSSHHLVVPSSSFSLLHREVFVIVARFVSFSPFYLSSGTTSGRTPPPRFFSRRSLSLVSQTLAKPHLGNGLSCRTPSKPPNRALSLVSNSELRRYSSLCFSSWRSLPFRPD